MGKIALVFIVVMASATFYFTSTSYQTSSTDQQKTQPRTWIDDKGNVHVLGLVLGESSVRDAELSLRSRADAAIFMYPLASEGKEKVFKLVLEAYFPSIADHSKVMLKLDITDTEMEAMRQRSTSPRIYPNGVARMNLSSRDILAVRLLKIKELTLVPSAQLNEKLLIAQFGSAASHTVLENGSTSYAYPALGLVANINDAGKDSLVFHNPKLGITTDKPEQTKH